MATDGLFSLDEIADRLAIEQVIARYVHALDARDYDALDDVFLPDTCFDLTEGGGNLWRRLPDGWRIAERTWRHGWIWGDYPLASLPGEF